MPVLPDVRLWLCAAIVFVLLALFAPLRSSGEEGPEVGAEVPTYLGQLEQDFERVAEQVSPSVVGIRVQRRYLTNLPGETEETTTGIYEQLVTVNGSGTIIDPAGLILTNEHVVQSATEIEVIFHDGQSLPATVVAADARGDLAVLKVDREGLTPARLVDWTKVARGQWAITLGNPYGLGEDGKLSIAVGVIANLGRKLPGLGEVDDRLYTDMIQTTAAIHPGCSGGPLFNVHGELVGVVTAMHTRAADDDGVGFAIPMTPGRRRLVDELRQGKPIVYGYVGLDVRALEPAEREAAALDPQVGVVVKGVDADGPAAAAGVREGDLVLRYDEQVIRGPSSLAELVGQTPPGRTVAVELRRGGQSLVVQTAVRQREVSRVSWMRGGAMVWRGMRLTDLTPYVCQRMGVTAGSVGVVVIDVADDSPAQRAAVQVGDVIDGVAETSVRDIAGFRTRVCGRQGPVKIRVRARGELVVSP